MSNVRPPAARLDTRLPLSASRFLFGGFPSRRRTRSAKFSLRIVYVAADGGQVLKHSLTVRTLGRTYSAEPCTQSRTQGPSAAEILF